MPSSRPILVLKTGSTFDHLIPARGDFEHWTARGMGLAPDQWICADVRRGDPLPDPAILTGCVITGSHDMVTDDADWMLTTGRWLAGAVDAGLPMLGICFGHQLMAHALGGRADYHPDGPEIGTVPVTLTHEAARDPLFSSLPPVFAAHVTHSQTASVLPPACVVLAASDHDRHQAFRLGRHAWGVQFHPEFDAEATRHYVTAQAAKIAAHGNDPDALRDSVRETPESADLLRRFAAYCLA
ncbi:MAG: glutamine amidotransferase [Pseudodesulfovibrio sp.]|uniref:Glutamine amidotransferase class-I n=1 Tax=Pseudodesulfovibrio aespoeensis (strain ATCC 700646 / DSM 10631 / Aspo-2) TaxID=643562 RepID=E6VZW2_PSEA9|nr:MULTISPECIES: glutamine amidotransferase [Pseudodesulfovibrio]MBU4193313.1 glutamine amidotransferase [Pseudomonadota bacterium]ADU64044.1 glutamine amidotransferase class-I [Pseudodesulfovibrio aespoeensis Aspo-2]MBU4244580.1 glutamine amidotransferase [Pseudomonadota bacterium]MBU4378212.1 glutamine amidotransferase [Pseudomonadota bacterium]MBU4475344.1 glutamine amidotransferase [Pseudomonadota bacterium]